MSKTAAAAPEPSMEDILASIRKIITDDEPAKPSQPVDASSEPPAPVEAPVEIAQAIEAVQISDPIDTVDSAAQAEDDVFELTPSMANETTPSISNAMNFDEDEDVCFAEEEPVAEIEPQKPVDMSSQQEIPVFSSPEPVYNQTDLHNKVSGIISPDVNEAISAQFANLSNLMFSQNARTIEDLVQDMMKPMLKGWLDQNLPSLVERVVREEIERVTRGRR